jgi:hypothetical protein
MQRVIAVWQQLAATTILVIAALSLCATTPMVRTADCGVHDCYHKYTFAASRPSGADNSVAYRPPPYTHQPSGELYDTLLDPRSRALMHQNMLLPEGAIGTPLGDHMAKSMVVNTFTAPGLAIIGEGISTAVGRLFGAPKINTPHGVAIQSGTPEAQAALRQVQSGTTVYRQGQLGFQNTGNAQYWSLQNPASTPNYANQMGMPSAAGGETWIMGGQLKPGSPVITRPAPAIPPNAGGTIEAVTQPGGVSINWFHMP